MSKRSFLYYDEMDSPVGTLTLLSTDQGLCRIDYGSMDDVSTKVNNWARKYFLSVQLVKDETKLAIALQQLQEYFQGQRGSFDLLVDCYGTPFQQKVWKALANIPYGETWTYKDVAMSIQAPRAVRAVGGAVNKNPLSILYPCHRVIGSNGSLVGYAGGLDRKEHLLIHENAAIIL